MFEFILFLAVCLFVPPLLFALVAAYLYLCEILWAIGGRVSNFLRAAGRSALKVLVAHA